MSHFRNTSNFKRSKSTLDSQKTVFSMHLEGNRRWVPLYEFAYICNKRLVISIPKKNERIRIHLYLQATF